MADEHVGGNSPMSTSEATPPHVVDSPEMVSQPSPPEEERVTSSTDHQPPEIVDSPGEPRVSSTSEEVNVGAGPSNQEPGAGPSSSDNAPEMANQPSPDGPPNPVIRDLLEAPPPPRPPASTTRREEQIPVTVGDSVRGAVKASMVVVGIKAAEGSHAGSSQEVTKEGNKKILTRNDSNQQFDVEDLSPGSKSSENVDLESDSSPMGSSVHGEERRGSGSSAKDDAAMESDSSPSIGTDIEVESSSGSSAKDDAGMESGSSPKIDIVIEAESSSGIGAPENVSLESELSSSKTGAVVPSSGTGTKKDVELERELSPSKTSLTVPFLSKMGTSSLQGSGSAAGNPEKPRENVSPKRKSPTKVDHLSPKRNAPFTDLQKQSESQMSTLLEELDIEEPKDTPGSSKPISGKEQTNMEIDESEENLKEETEQESNMEVQETDSQKAEDETTEKDSKKDDSGKDDAK